MNLSDKEITEILKEIDLDGRIIYKTYFFFYIFINSKCVFFF